MTARHAGTTALGALREELSRAAILLGYPMHHGARRRALISSESPTAAPRLPEASIGEWIDGEGVAAPQQPQLQWATPSGYFPGGPTPTLGDDAVHAHLMGLDGSAAIANDAAEGVAPHSLIRRATLKHIGVVDDAVGLGHMTRSARSHVNAGSVR